MRTVKLGDVVLKDKSWSQDKCLTGFGLQTNPIEWKHDKCWLYHY